MTAVLSCRLHGRTTVVATVAAIGRERRQWIAQTLHPARLWPCFVVQDRSAHLPLWRLGLDVLERRGGPLRVSTGNCDGSSKLSQPHSRFLAQTRVSTRDDGALCRGITQETALARTLSGKSFILELLCRVPVQETR